MALEIRNLRLAAPAERIAALASFYGGRLRLPLTRSGDDRLEVAIGETVLELAPSEGAPYYHVAFLVPGDRFDAALAWARDTVELLPDADTGDPVFDFTNWDARAVYFHDPAGSIVELIAHRGVGEAGTTGAFSPSELLGVSEIGLVCDPPSLASALERELGLEVWDGTVEGEGRLAFVGTKARTLILCRAGRPWLPTGRPAEAHPVEVTLAGASSGTVALADGSRMSVTAS
jgi:catechol 2,3-dioxygenase-like lactoylglutathione lyase family enzyme